MIGAATQRVAIGGSRTLPVAEIFKCARETDPAFDMVWIHAQRLPKQAFGAFDFAVLRQLPRQPAASLWHIGAVPHGAFEASEGILELLRLDQKRSEIEIGFGAARVDDQCGLQRVESRI